MDERIIITATVEITITNEIRKATPYQLKRAIEVDMNKAIEGIGTVKVTEIEGLNKAKIEFD